MTDHLTRAKEFIAKGDDFYGKAADEIIAAQKENPTLSNVEIGRRLGRHESWVRKLVQSRTTSSRAPDESLSVDWSSGSNKREDVAGKVLREAPIEQVERIMADMPLDRRRKIQRAQEALAFESMLSEITKVRRI